MATRIISGQIALASLVAVTAWLQESLRRFASVTLVTVALYRSGKRLNIAMTPSSRAMKFAVIFCAVGVVAGVLATLVFTDDDFRAMFQNAFKGQSRFYNTGATYPSTLAIGQQGRFVGIATGGKEPYTYEWKFGDGQVLSGSAVNKTFDSAGRQYFTLVTTDSAGIRRVNSEMYVDIVEGPPRQIGNVTQTH